MYRVWQNLHFASTIWFYNGAQKWMSALCYWWCSSGQHSMFNQKSTLANCVHASLYPLFHCFQEIYVIFSRLKLVISLSTNWEFFVTEKKIKISPLRQTMKWDNTTETTTSHDGSVFIICSKEPTIIIATFTKCF